MDDTICALSTAPGRAGIAVVRISGPQSFDLVRELFIPENPRETDLPSRQAVLGRVIDLHDGDELDQALVTFFPSPASYTGEDVAEVSVHGSPVLVSTILDSFCSRGARLAEPGEFTQRAFVRGRMDLSQAEAVHDIIEAKTLYQLQIAARQRSGEVARQIEPIKKLLIDVIVQLESAIEFVEEDLSIESREELAVKLEIVGQKVEEWIRSFGAGRLIHDGFSMAIVGKANVGKSSLFNALLDQDRSIVTEIPGTTRDLVTEFTHLDGIPVRLVDTAGVRDSRDKVEQMGVERSLQVISDVDALLLVVDISQPPDLEDENLRARLQGLSCVVVMNKSDLPCAWSQDEKEAYSHEWARVEVSALTQFHIDNLRKMILQRLFGDRGPERDGLLVTHVRHCQCLERARKALSRASDALREGMSEEFALVDLHSALQAIGEITGETRVEDLLGEIFSRFCVGK